MLLGAAFLFSVTLVHAQPVSPFTTIEVSRQYDGAGKVKAESRFLFAVNRDGSIVSVDLDPAMARRRQIIDVVN